MDTTQSRNSPHRDRQTTPPPTTVVFPLTPPPTDTTRKGRVQKKSRSITPPSPTLQSRLDPGKTQNGRVSGGNATTPLDLGGGPINVAHTPEYPYFSPRIYNMRFPSPGSPTLQSPGSTDQRQTGELPHLKDTPAMEKFMGTIHDMADEGCPSDRDVTSGPGLILHNAWWISRSPRGHRQSCEAGDMSGDIVKEEPTTGERSHGMDRTMLRRPTPLFLDSEGETERGADASMKGEDEGSDDEVLWVKTERSRALLPANDPSCATGSAVQVHYDEAFDLIGAIPEKRAYCEDDDEEEVEYQGQKYDIKRPRLIASQDERRDEQDENETPLRELQAPCEACGCKCGVDGLGGRGSGSKVLSRHVRANILEFLLGTESLYRQLKGGNTQYWADIAQQVGARREDFDRVRHCARDWQTNLPGRVRRGEI